TLFERLAYREMPFYVLLMDYLAKNAYLPAPKPLKAAYGQCLFQLHGKPLVCVERLYGKSQLEPNAVHCFEVGKLLACLHNASVNFQMRQANLRGFSWYEQVVPLVCPYLTTSTQAFLQKELSYQRQQLDTQDYRELPRGAIHADLFRDNVLFQGDVLTGVFDFYFACTDAFILDVAIAINDWTVDPSTGQISPLLHDALLQGYAEMRLLTVGERKMLPFALRLAALRFWLSRLWDQHYPREASLLKAHNPEHFERILQQRL
ncbi:MAG: homoserine kinase, partial [Gammaproteobacteria bacterium]|nr:homoserine kinase [Gammaproteobacteria bacterium]